MALRIEKCIATPTEIAIFFSESIDPTVALSLSATYTYWDPATGTATPVLGNKKAGPKHVVAYHAIEKSIRITGLTLAMGTLVAVSVTGVTDASGKHTITDDGIHNACTARVNGEGDSKGPGDNGGARDVSDLQSYPVLTEEMPAGTISGATRPATTRLVGGASTLGQTADQAIRDVLSWRTKADDPKGFVAALSQAFDLKQVEGHTEWGWTPRSYTVQTDLGAVTGAQASIYTRAKAALDQSLPLLDGLYALLPNVEPEDLASVQAVVRTQFTALANEFGVVGGPRVPRVDELFELLLGPGTPTDPEHISREGSLGIVRQRFGLERKFVVTVDDEQNLTNYIILVDYLIGLKQSWNYEKSFFIRIRGGEGEVERQPFFGTQLVLIARALDVVAQGVQDAYFAMDSVFMGDAERQTSQLDFASLKVWLPDPKTKGGSVEYEFYHDTSGLFVAELLDWVDRAASEELPGLLKDAGKDGLQSFKAATNRLRAFVRAAIPPEQKAPGLPPGYHTPRVKRAMKLLRDGLDEAYLLAYQVPSAEFPPDLSQGQLSRIEGELRSIREKLHMEG